MLEVECGIAGVAGDVGVLMYREGYPWFEIFWLCFDLSGTNVGGWGVGVHCMFDVSFAYRHIVTI